MKFENGNSASVVRTAQDLIELLSSVPKDTQIGMDGEMEVVIMRNGRSGDFFIDFHEDRLFSDDEDDD